MTISEQLLKQYKFADMAFKMNMKGVSHEDSIVLPKPAGSCINWIVGHLLATREDILELLGIDPMQSDEETKPYYRDGDSSATDQFTNLPELLDMFGDTQMLILEKLEELDDEQLSQPIPNDNPDVNPVSLSSRLFFYHFHEAYHIGQIGLVRRLIGKEGAI